MEAENLFREKLLEHYNHPRNAGIVKNPDFSFIEYNYACGDQIKIEGHIEDGIIRSLAFAGAGCILSQAVASMLTEACTGKSAQEVLALDKEFVLGLIGSTLGPTRLRCALLSLSALQHGLTTYVHEK